MEDFVDYIRIDPLKIEEYCDEYKRLINEKKTLNDKLLKIQKFFSRNIRQDADYGGLRFLIKKQASY